MYRLYEDLMEEIEIKKSRFLCYLQRVDCEEEAKAFINKIKKAHPNARHHCYAFVIGEHNEIQRSNDDGEPAGTAGVPMLECLMNRNMQDICAVTVRYFGGIKLGAGGLIRAYSKSVSNALNHAIITKKEKMKIYQISFSYDLIGKIDYYFRSNNIEIIDKDYGNEVYYTCLCKDDISDDMASISNGKCEVIFIDEEIVDVKMKQTIEEEEDE